MGKKLVVIICLLLVSTFFSYGQNGSLISRTEIDISKTELWDIISSNDTLLPQYEYAEQLDFSQIVYSSDSLNIDGFLITPKTKGNYPVVIFNRGGNREYGELTLGMLFFFTADLANEGYIILASNYRSQDEFGGKDLNDVLNLISVADEIENADTTRIGMFGWSRGGMMTYMSLKESDRIKTAVIGNGASDLFLTISERPEMEVGVYSECIPNYWTNKDIELTARSAIFWPDSLNKQSSLLLLCGSLDTKVDFQQSLNMAAKLDSIDYEYELKVYETDHSFRGKLDELHQELTTWFNARLKAVPAVSTKKISITIDDVPNTRKFQADSNRSILIEVLDSLNIPIAIFINERLINFNKDTVQHLQLLEEWAKREYVTLGNHTYSHLRYSDVGFEEFKKDIENGEVISKQLSSKYNKELKYFRFPYNDLGIDSVQHVRMDSLLRSMSYRIAPFTIESSDWIFNALYENYISNERYTEAHEIGMMYVTKTIDYIHFFDSLSQSIYGRDVSHIYMCHDNSINAKYLKEIVKALEIEKYEFISIDEAMGDSIFDQKDIYHKKWGISWLYRWMSDGNERKKWMMQEPDIGSVESAYNSLVNSTTPEKVLKPK